MSGGGQTRLGYWIRYVCLYYTCRRPHQIPLFQFPSSSNTYPGPPISAYAFRAGVAVAWVWGIPRSGMPLGITRRVSPPWVRCPGMGASWATSSGGAHPSSGGANQTNVPPSTYSPIALQWSCRPKELHSKKKKK